MTIERRFLGAPELRAEGDVAPKIVGYAALFNSRSKNLGGFVEVIESGAFTDAMGDDVRALWNHDPNHVLGRTKAGTLKMTQDDRGLMVEIDPPSSAAALIESMRRGDVDQMSFGFRVVSQDWAREDDMIVRKIKAVRLFDVSVVTYPAYPDTTVAVRSLQEFQAAQDAGPDLSLLRARLRLAGA